MALFWEAKFDPDEEKDFTLDWSELLDGDTINGSNWELPADALGYGLEIDTSKPSNGIPYTSTSTTVWLKINDPDTQADDLITNQPYFLQNTVTTVGLRTYQRTVKLKMKEL